MLLTLIGIRIYKVVRDYSWQPPPLFGRALFGFSVPCALVAIASCLSDVVEHFLHCVFPCISYYVLRLALVDSLLEKGELVKLSEVVLVLAAISDSHIAPLEPQGLQKR